MASPKNPKYQIFIKNQDGETLGELANWQNLTFSDRHNNYGECIFDLPVLSNDLSTLVSLRRFETHVLRDGVVVWSGEQALRGGKLQANSPNLITIRSYTFVEGLNAMLTQPYIRFDQVDQAEILKQLVDYFQTLPYGNHRFTFGPIIATMPRDREFSFYEVMNAFINMSNVINGPDFWVDENKVIHIVPYRGVDKSKQVILEYDTNLLEVDINEDFSAPANQVFALGSGFGSEQQIGMYQDPTYSNIYRLRQKAISEIDINDVENLNDKAHLRVNQNKTAVLSVSATQFPNTEPVFGSVSIGDTVSLKVQEGNYNINQKVRVYGYEVRIGQNGEEQVAYLTAQFTQ